MLDRGSTNLSTLILSDCGNGLESRYRWCVSPGRTPRAAHSRSDSPPTPSRGTKSRHRSWVFGDGRGQFTQACAALGADFEQYISGRPLSTLSQECSAAAAVADNIASILGAAAAACGLEDISYNETVNRLVARSQIEELELEFRKDERFDTELLGPGYAGHRTDFVAIRRVIDWADDVRAVVGRAVSGEVAQSVLFLDLPRQQDGIQQLFQFRQLRQALLDEFLEGHRASVRAELETPFAETSIFLHGLAESIDDIVEWGRYSAALTALQQSGLASAANFCVQKQVAASHVNGIVRRSALESWVDAVRQSDQRLKTFAAQDRDHITNSFRELDQRLIRLSASKAVEVCNARRPTLGAGAAGLIASEANKQRRHMPIRVLVEQAAPVVQALKPCMMMSPLSVSQFLPSSMRFDVVVFDEASQVRPADAINCIYRGRQLIVAGDQKQLPPTPFFDRLENDASDEWEEDQLENYESVLDTAKGAGLRSLALRWHYRSQHEDLITYSNYSFYDGQLVTFPSAKTDGADVGIQLFVVPGVYRRGGHVITP